MSSIIEDNTHNPILQQLKKALSQIPEGTLREFSLSIFPCHTSNDVYQSMLNNISFKIQISNSKTFKHTITKQILQKASPFGSLLKESLTQLLSGDFLDKLKVKNNIICLDSSKENVSKNDKRKKAKEKEVDVQNTKRKIYRFEDNSQSYSKGKITSKLRSSSADKIDFVTNIQEGKCDCDQLTNVESDNFECCHCNCLFQFQFAKKDENNKSNECLLCHLKYLIPNRPVYKQLFAGVLKKGRKKHEITFKIEEQDLQSCRNMQIRCFRLSERTKNFILYPDLCEIQINGSLIKQFVPLHKQSSLKYRKDEPLTVNFMQLSHDMKIIITEEQKDKIGARNDRVQFEDHLIAFYLINELTCDQLCREIESTCLTTFQQSLNLLNFLLKGQNNIQEVSLEMIKIPLLCTLSTERIKVPVRGIFCKHFQCFDLHNYVYMIAQSANPRWLCPLCRLPAYHLKVDCILYAILTEHSQVNKLSEVLFFRNDQYSISNKPTQKNRQSIHQLNFQSLRKRRHYEESNRVVSMSKERVIDLVS